MIVEYKIVKEGKFGYFELIRAYGSSKRYLSMIKMLQNIDREDLETLWKLVKAKHRRQGQRRIIKECYRMTNIKFRGGLLGLKDFKMILRVTAAQLQLLSDYYCWKDYADRDEIKDLLEKR
ncbi:hypothetical protein Tco_0084527 [Tanacetum coccineum]